MNYYNVNAVVVGVLAYSEQDAAASVKGKLRDVGIAVTTTAQPTHAHVREQLQLFPIAANVPGTGRHV